MVDSTKRHVRHLAEVVEGETAQPLESFGDLLRRTRQARRLSQEDAAQLSGVSVRTIRDLERGRVAAPRRDTTDLLADALELSGESRERFLHLASTGTTDGPTPQRADRAPTVPHLLPPGLARFVGRDDDLTQVRQLLRDEHGPRTVIVTGPVGVGKTALAIRVGHMVTDAFPDGQLYADLCGFDPSGAVRSPAEVIRAFLDSLGVGPHEVPASLDAQVVLYRTLLTGRRVLVVLDNARDTDHVRDLLPGSSGCRALVTSRSQLTDLVTSDAAHPKTLDLLSAAEARQLLVSRLGATRIAAEPGAVEHIITSCARLPLALAIVAARAATNPRFPLSALARELHETQGGLDAFADVTATIDVRAVLSSSYLTLGSSAARLFRLLGMMLPGPDIGVPGAASLAGVPVSQARPLLAELVRANMLAEPAPRRYNMHDLLRAYALELASAHDADAARSAALRRLLDHYLHTANAADRAVSPHRAPVTLTPASSGAVLVEFTDDEPAVAWLTAEYPVLLAALRQAADSGFYTHTWQLAWTLANTFDRRGRWHDQVAANRLALEAAHRAGDRIGQAHAHRGLGRANARHGHLHDAQGHLRQALDLCHEQTEPDLMAQIQHSISAVLTQKGRHREALRHAHESLRLFEAADRPSGRAAALNALGWNHAQLNEHRQTISYCESALAVQQEVADRRGEAATWDTLGYAHHHLGQHQEAIRCYRHALELFLKTGDRYYQADTLVHLGDTQHATGDSDSARRTWEQALEILDDLGHASAEVVRTKVLTSTTDLALTGLDPPCPEAGLATRSCPPSPRR